MSRFPFRLPIRFRFRFLALGSALLLSCCSQSQLQQVSKLPKSLSENSGLAWVDSQIWTIQDSGNPAELYALDQDGNITRTIKIAAANRDWEDLTADAQGNIYIGDFGNNKNERRDLAIYKVEASALHKTEAAVSTLSFFFPEQTEFPPKKSQRVFDVEAFFYYDDQFYLFTKNRSSKFDGTTTLYKIPNQPGKHAAQKLGSFQTCAGFNHCAVTSADISPDGKTVALLSANYVWLFSGFSQDRYLDGKVRQIDLEHFSQKEGLCFKGNGTLLLSDERKKNNGGNLYELELSEAKP